MTSKVTLKIVTHNVYWFQGSSFAEEKPGEPLEEVLKRLIDIYSRLNPDILCLQEIQSDRAAEEIAEKLRMRYFYTKGVLFPYYGGAIFLKEGVKVLRYQYSKKNVTRMWQKLSVRLAPGKTVTLCNLHLPSGRLLGKESLMYRLRDLKQVLNEGVDPDIVVGDFNEPPHGPVYEYMLWKGYIDIAKEEPTTLGETRVDYTWVHRRILKTILEYSVYRNILFAERNIFLSDHYPIIAVIALK
ncbi:hypothetical protein CW702_00780 [Candidatus Bathyarchaeota archaeon]|nr:MAG: hypothetical protein CW702_00780 [Candidatus Bathyarchaeota archaeon]